MKKIFFYLWLWSPTILAVLKVAGVIDCSWWWTVVPMGIPAAACAVTLITCAVMELWLEV